MAAVDCARRSARAVLKKQHKRHGHPLLREARAPGRRVPVPCNL
jgi:hypothetical protein